MKVPLRMLLANWTFPPWGSARGSICVMMEIPSHHGPRRDIFATYSQ